jgi:acetyltransferase-like isoleucine patch superfamily enzyme
MNKVITFIKLILIDFIQYFKWKFVEASYKVINLNSKFYKGSVLINSFLEGYNILFYNTQVINSSIGKHTYIQKSSTVVNAEVGKFCSIASFVSIGPGVHKIDGVTTHPAFYLKNTPLLLTFSDTDIFESSKRTIIGNDVWIGEKAIILDGVSIGNGAVIASGAVVHKDVPPYAIFGGVPAKLIRYRFSEEIILKLLQSEWWDWPESVLAEEFSSFADVKEFEKLIKI